MATSCKARVYHIALAVVLGACIVALIESPTILASAGGMSGYLLTVAAVAVIPLSLGKGRVFKLLSALVILSCLHLAYRDHVDGLRLQERILRVKLKAELSATQ